ncbi:hypothetical protein BDD43_1958 [Mucilaginibacter gracilis]|uniref:Uncharacterized protein n=1 Tax=Mucilaginibacter gracilis TaxID=423350 RepID=A0A495IZ06_9SPHI|nr:hypothetical protein BDD43_1958 [Mucilaginibacter gracilis]
MYLNGLSKPLPGVLHLLAKKTFSVSYQSINSLLNFKLKTEEYYAY